ncbi:MULTISPECIES: pyridoxamine 5'-phosphate oxidase family protein [unclassified Tenacibaculum]|uniref:pyridoxamine 5'-phosphate oxidase family protein n=1 Tax=unclassified Tenacibaculum TaxID=2635139 RepID=UPI001F16F0B0|nr:MULTISPECIES: pyridoxamine 5'-phosphate oxidase family protein [unclassified Tenacibaculum]MCF2873849.1 pyridoxamine 5'-phosphate oxidase family protein [Tenacibaculum sp. Cn5-1]MCF2936659.1 pyridoxamine 5'-phosphate oxidase family protein [Tenacibaculum sp. Cn5-34]MCG7512883.1 pyridoxamine 5'-phosphate oxidase family protein [Tenacibaculum sp. Cn5-46]
MKEYSKSKLNRVKRGQNRATYDVEKINTILDAGFIGYVSYVYQGGAITLPMAYGRKDNKIYLHGSQANRMLLALLEAKEMSMTVMHLDALVLARSGLHHSVNYRSATLFGSVKKVTNPEEKDAALFCFMEHMMKGRWDGIRPMYQEELDRTMVVEMTIETASAKIRDVGVADEPEDYNLNVWAGLVPIKQIALPPISDEKLKEGIEIPQHVTNYYNQNK